MNPTIPVRAPVSHPRVGADRATFVGPRAGQTTPTARRSADPYDPPRALSAMRSEPRYDSTHSRTCSRTSSPTCGAPSDSSSAHCGRWPMLRRRTSCAPRSRSTWSRPRVDDMTGRRAAAWRNGARGRRPVQAPESRRTPPRWILRPHRWRHPQQPWTSAGGANPSAPVGGSSRACTPPQTLLGSRHG
jgi:hypothetical protein